MKEILRKIRYSTNINFRDKSLAINDIIEMFVSKDYAEKVSFNFEETELDELFAWQKSILGFKFWEGISIQLNNNNSVLIY